MSSLSFPSAALLESRVTEVVSLQGYTPDEASCLARISAALLSLASHAPLAEATPSISTLRLSLLKALEDRASEPAESYLLQLYSALHASGESYTAHERATLSQYSGYICYAGGLSPLLMARQDITQETVSVDLGAGNGLQGLLLQWLYPHRRTLQVELSSSLIQVGKTLQQVLEIDPERLEWRHEDIASTPLSEVDFVYLYRPVRPTGEGLKLYQTLARRLETLRGGTIIFSVADCLSPLLSPSFRTTYCDGHLTRFEKIC